MEIIRYVDNFSLGEFVGNFPIFNYLRHLPPPENSVSFN